MKKLLQFVCAFILFSGIISCKKEFVNPNAPVFPDVGETTDGMVQLVVGIKNRFAVNSIYGNGSVFNSITANGFTTNELSLKAGGNLDFGQLVSGGNNIATSNVVLTELWSNCMLINNYSSFLINNVQRVVQDSGLKVNIRKYAYLYKALSIGTLANYWQELPVATGDKASFVSRAEALRTAISLLETASQLPDLPPPPDYSASFGTEISLKNVFNALMARYHVMLGNFDKAIASANAVNLKTRSVFVYNPQNPNPIYRSGFFAVFGYGPKASFGLPASLSPTPGDGRINFYLTGNPQTGFGFAKSDADSLPIFLPGEMLLIQAEAYVRKTPSDLINGRKFLDSVLRKTNSQDVFRIGANLPAYSGPMDPASLLQEIYKNRCIELFMSGMRLEDSRRFARPGPADPNPERNRNYYPYPFQERNGNPNTPKDPDN
jgi:starch-binding outer membrane protein, SusD/RagB family